MNGLLVLLLLLPHVNVRKRTMMLLMLWRDCLGWLIPDCSLWTLWRGMKLKGVLTRMTMNMDGDKYVNVGCTNIKKTHLLYPNVAGSACCTKPPCQFLTASPPAAAAP